MPLRLRDVAQVDAGVAQLPFLRIPQPEQQRRQRTFTSAAVAADGDALARRERQIESVQYRAHASGPCKRHLLQLQRASAWHIECVHRITDRWRLIHDRLQALRRTTRALQRLQRQPGTGPYFQQGHGQEHQACSQLGSDQPTFGSAECEPQHAGQTHACAERMQQVAGDQPVPLDAIACTHRGGRSVDLLQPGALRIDRSKIGRAFQAFERLRAQGGALLCTQVLALRAAACHLPRHQTTDQHAEHQQQPRSGQMDQRRGGNTGQPDAKQGRQRCQGAHAESIDLADVGHQPRQQIAGAGGRQAPWRQRQRAAEKPHPQIAGDAQSGIVADQFFAITRCDTRESQGANTGRRREKIEAGAHAGHACQRRCGQEAAG